MVAVQEFAVIVQNRAAGGAPLGVGVPPGGSFGVGVRQELVESCGHVVNPAESPHQALFLGGVGLFAAWPSRRALRGAQGPSGGIVPVGVGSEQGIRRQRLALAGAEKYRFTVTAGAGPVHEPLCFKGCRVQCAHQRVDGLRRCSGNGLVFIRADRAVDGNDDPDARVLRVVLAGAVDQVVAAEPLHGLAQILCGAALSVVNVQGYHAAGLAATAFATALCQGGGHKAAVVFEQILLGAGHGHVLCVGLGAHGAVPAGLLDEPWPGPVHLLPYFIGSAGADAQSHVTILL